jgi:hypothetical protein
MGYFRYVRDILAMFKGNLTNTQDVLKEFNALCTNLNITLQEEQNKLNFLGINIYKSDNILTFGICRKPATTDCCLPYEYKTGNIPLE